MSKQTPYIKIQQAEVKIKEKWQDSLRHSYAISKFTLVVKRFVDLLSFFGGAAYKTISSVFDQFSLF